MYKALIADDELFVRKNIRERLKFCTTPITVIGEAEDAACALRLYETHLPDMLFVDINMPGMDGLDMVRAIQEKFLGCKTKFIVISGYDDFSHLQRALRIGVHNYMRKPIVQEEFLEVLAETCEMIEEDRKQEPAFGQENVLQYACGAGADRQWRCGNFYLLHETVLKKQALMPSLFFEKRILNETQKEACFFVSFDQVAGLLLVLEVNKHGTNLSIVQKKAEQMAHQLEAQVVCGNFTEETLEKIVQRAERYLSLRFLKNNQAEQIIVCNQLPRESGVFSAEAFSTLLERGKEDQALLWLDELEEFKLGAAARLLTVSYAYHAMVLSLMNLYVKFELDVPEELRRALHPFFMAQDATLEEVKLRLAGFVKAYIEQYEGLHQSNDLIVRVKQYLKQHFAEEVSLQTLANELFVSPAYLSMRFKSKNGLNITQYLENIRMKKASEYLRQTELSVAEVADLVGYRDASYFTRVFRKTFDCSPRMYRVDRVNKR